HDLLDGSGGEAARTRARRALGDRRRAGRGPLLPQHGRRRGAAAGRLDQPRDRRRRSALLKPPEFDYEAPASLDQALALLRDDPEAKVLAGGQSLIPLLAMRLAA